MLKNTKIKILFKGKILSSTDGEHLWTQQQINSFMRTVEHFTVARAGRIKATIEFCAMTYTKAQQLHIHICSEL